MKFIMPVVAVLTGITIGFLLCIAALLVVRLLQS